MHLLTAEAEVALADARRQRGTLDAAVAQCRALTADLGLARQELGTVLLLFPEPDHRVDSFLLFPNEKFGLCFRAI